MNEIKIRRTDGDIIFSHKEDNNNIAKTLIEAIKGGITDFSYADFRDESFNNAEFSDMEFNKLNFHNARFDGSNFSDVLFYHTTFSEVDFSHASFFNTNFGGALFNTSIFRDIKFDSCRFSKSIFSFADFSYSCFKNISLSNVDLCYVNIIGANFRGIKYDNIIKDRVLINEHVFGFNPICPEEGSFIGYKKCGRNIVKLEICEDALRSSATSLKCRCSKAKVLEIQNFDGSKSYVEKVHSNYDPNFIYTVGEIVEVKKFDTDRWNECSTGIHFFINRESAVHYE